MASKAPKVSKSELARNYLIASPTASNEEVVKATGVSPRLVSMVRASMRAEGLIPKAFGDWTSGGGDPRYSVAMPSLPDAGALLTTGTADLMRRAEEEQTKAGHEFTIEEQLRLCSAFATNPKESPQVRLAALTVYNKIKSETVGRDQLGPGAPLTDEDRIHRLALLMEAVGPNIVAMAFMRAFPKDDHEAHDAETPRAVQDAPIEEGHDTGGSAAQA